MHAAMKTVIERLALDEKVTVTLINGAKFTGDLGETSWPEVMMIHTGEKELTALSVEHIISVTRHFDD